MPFTNEIDSKICEGEGTSYNGSLSVFAELQRCGCGTKIDLGCLASASYNYDNTNTTEQKFLNCPSVTLEDLQAGATFEIIGQHNPDLVTNFYGAAQKTASGETTLPLSGMCFEEDTDCIKIPFLNEDDSAPVVTITGVDANGDPVTLVEGTDFELTTTEIDSQFKGKYTEYCVTPITGGDLILGQEYSATVTVTPYETISNKITTGSRVSSTFRLCLTAYEPVDGGVPKINQVVFDQVRLNSSFSLPFIDGTDGFTLSNIEVQAVDKSCISTFTQSDK